MMGGLKKIKALHKKCQAPSIPLRISGGEVEEETLKDLLGF